MTQSRHLVLSCLEFPYCALLPIVRALTLSPGKTSLTQQFVTPPTYNDNYYPTIESTSQKVVKYKGIEYDCEIVDTAGQVRPGCAGFD